MGTDAAAVNCRSTRSPIMTVKVFTVLDAKVVPPVMLTERVVSAPFFRTVNTLVPPDGPVSRNT